MKRLSLAVLAVAILLVAPNAFGASNSHWKKSVATAREALKKREFETARTVLQSVAAEAAELGPQSSAENSLVLAAVYYEERNFADALTTLDAALEKIGPSPRSSQLQLWQGVHLVAKAFILIESKKLDAGIAAGDQARTVLENAAGKYHPELYRLNALLGDVHWRRKNYPAAEKAFLDALKQAERKEFVPGLLFSDPDQSHGQMYQVQNSKSGPLRITTALGDLSFEAGKLLEAREYYKKSLKIAENAYGKKSASIVLPLEGQARLNLKEGRRADFEKDTQRIYDIVLKEPGFKLWVANPFWQKFELEWKENKSDAASKTALQIASIFHKQNFEARLIAQRAWPLLVGKSPDWNRAAQGMQLIRHAAATAYADEIHQTGLIAAEFGSSAEKANQIALARENFEAFAKTQENAPDKTFLISALGKLGEMSLAENKPADALPYYHRRTEAMRQKFGHDLRVADIMDKEAAVLKQAGQEQAATDLQAKAAEMRKSAVLRR